MKREEFKTKKSVNKNIRKYLQYLKLWYEILEKALNN